MSEKPRIHLRPPEAGDLPFIFNSFLKSYRDSSAVSGIPNSIYYKEMHAIVERMLTRSNVVIVCDPGEPGIVFGYGVAEVVKDDLILHWLYVKHSFRNFGLAKEIERELLKLPHTAVKYSCRTGSTGPLLKKRPTYIYDPFSLWSK